MGTFEFDNRCENSNSAFSNECIMANRVFDQCRLQLCLTPDNLGPARAAKSTNSCGDVFCEGDIIVPPCNAASVMIEDFSLCKILIENKKPNPFRPGFWDITIKYIFTYTLIFTSVDGNELCRICATSTFTTKLTLFGSVCTDIVMVSDLNNHKCNSSGPFVTVEGKAVALAAELRYPSNNCNSCCGCCGCNSCGCDACSNNGCGNNSCGNNCNNNCTADSCTSCPTAVNVTIGLFSIIKTFRPVNIVVPSSGFCTPEECEGTGVSGQNVCDFFDSIEFPFDLFSPPACPSAVRGGSTCDCADDNLAGGCGSFSRCGCSNR